MLQHTNTKVMRSAYARWLNCDQRTLTECYRNPSTAKRNAWGHCVHLALCFSGDEPYRTPCVLGYNTSTFSVGFTGEIDGRRAFFFITRDHERYIFIDEM